MVLESCVSHQTVCSSRGGTWLSELPVAYPGVYCRAWNSQLSVLCIPFLPSQHPLTQMTALSVKPFLTPLLGFHTLRPPSPLTASASQSPSLIPSLFPSSKQSYILSYNPTDVSSPKSPKGRKMTLRKMPRATVLTITSNLEATKMSNTSEQCRESWWHPLHGILRC